MENIRFLLCLILAKVVIRMTFNNISIGSIELRNRIMFLVEHILFSFWGWYVIVYLQGSDQSWLLKPILCWNLPHYPSEGFRFFYCAKVASHTEDLLYIGYSIVNSYFPQRSKSSDDNHLDMKMIIHHISTALLCISSYLTGYVRIGSIVMFLHDISDIPLDAVRIFTLVNWSAAQIISFVLTVLMWLYWRLWYMPTAVLFNITKDSKSLIIETSCQAGSCPFSEVPERTPFLILLGALQILHVIWFGQLCSKGYRTLFGTKQKKAM